MRSCSDHTNAPYLNGDACGEKYNGIMGRELKRRTEVAEVTFTDTGSAPVQKFLNRDQASSLISDLLLFVGYFPSLSE